MNVMPPNYGIMRDARGWEVELRAFPNSGECYILSDDESIALDADKARELIALLEKFIREVKGHEGDSLP